MGQPRRSQVEVPIVGRLLKEWEARPLVAGQAEGRVKLPVEQRNPLLLLREPLLSPPKPISRNLFR
jgi:hypothetical protein